MISFQSNIGPGGRIIRGTAGLLAAGGAVLVWPHVWWAALVLGLAGAFLLFEAVRGWCGARACGIRTPF